MRTRRLLTWLTGAAALILLSGCGLTLQDFSPNRPTVAAKTFTDEQDRALAEAIDDNDSSEIEEQLAAGGDPNAVGADRITMLQFAVRRDSVVGVEKLLAAKADPDAVGIGGKTALHLAVLQDDDRLTELLLGAGANVSARTASGVTPLYESASSRNETRVKRLLSAGADTEVLTSLKETPLFPAARINSGNVVLALLEGGVDPLVRNGTGATFQTHYFQYDRKLLNDRALAERAAVIAWLRANDVPVDPNA